MKVLLVALAAVALLAPLLPAAMAAPSGSGYLGYGGATIIAGPSAVHPAILTAPTVLAGPTVVDNVIVGPSGVIAERRRDLVVGGHGLGLGLGGHYW